MIKDTGKIFSDKVNEHYNLKLKEEVRTENWLPTGTLYIGVTEGASCPNNLFEETIRRFDLRGISVGDLLKQYGIPRLSPTTW